MVQWSDTDPATLIYLSKFKQQIMKQSSNKYILLNPSMQCQSQLLFIFTASVNFEGIAI